MKGPVKVFLIMGFTLVVLLLLYHLPIMKVGDSQLRQVDVLADLDPAADDVYDSVPDVPEAPKGPWTDVWPDSVQPILDYGTDSTSGMDRFYAALAQGGKLGRPVRIAYLSDSFVEGDIMLVDLRRQLQKRFGNGGLGWMRCRTNFDEGTFAASLSSKGFTPCHIMKQGSFNRSQYIITQGYGEVNGSASATVASLTGDMATTWNHATVWGCASARTTVTGTPTGKTATWAPGSGLQKASFSAARMNRFSLAVNGTAKVFGMALENDSGIVVDNFGVRGSSGLNLVEMNEALSRQFAAQHPYDLIVIHFGLNAISKTSGDKACTWYTGAMKKCVERIKALYPHSAVLIASASDRAERNGSGQVASLPSIEMLVGYQKKMAAEAAVGFISIYHLMGGRGCMVKMVQQHCAEKDYTHINRKGGRVVAEKYAQSLIAGFENYQQKKAAGY